MAVPQHKVSKRAGNSRYANWKIKTPAIRECPQCQEMMLNHRVCKNCGYYDGVQRVEIKEKTE